MITPARFNMSSEDVRKIEPPELPLAFVWEFLMDGRTPGRAMADKAIREYLRALEGPGTIIELGAGGDYYKRFVNPGQTFLISNLSSQGFDLYLDMTRLDLANESADALFSAYALEHIYDYKAAIDEQFRVLKPGGRMLLVVPFMYYYHAAPDDFFRFTASALDRLLASFTILVRQPLGGRAHMFAEFLHEKKVLGSSKGPFASTMLRILAAPLVATGLGKHDSRFALAFAYICEKPSNSEVNVPNHGLASSGELDVLHRG